jgi:RNA polymerase sigma-70 factor (ECF subfamily)
MLDGEKQLIREAMGHDGAPAFGKLYDHYHPRIYRFIYLKVTGREEAEDLAHQVFLSAWQNIGSYTFRGFPFSSWLYQIARNKLIDHYRTVPRHQPLEYGEVQQVSSQEDLAASTDISLNIDRVRKVLHRLPHEQQDILIMRFVEDLSHREIAVALNKSEGSVKVAQHRALKRLKEILTDETPGAGTSV